MDREGRYRSCLSSPRSLKGSLKGKGSLSKAKGAESKPKRQGNDSKDENDDDASRRSLLRRISDSSLKRIGSFAGSRSLKDFDSQGQPDDDPVIALLEARNKQRVRFCLEGNIETTTRNVDPPRNEPFMIKEPPVTIEDSDEVTSNASFNIKSFMGRIIFQKAGSSSYDYGLEDDLEKSSIVWESNEVEEESPEVVHTTNKMRSLTVCFSENPYARATVVKLLDKARRAQFSHYRYRYAVQCCIKANELLREARYPDDHPLVGKTIRLLNNAHHALNCFDNSAKIVKMGIKYEDQNDLVRALKMYTIAYRIRRDQISRTHPSLVVLLNILGSIQLKRGELREAMHIYELALRDAPAMVSVDDDDELVPTPSSNLLARAVTFREMGIIHEKWGNPAKALSMYHRSLDSISEWREKTGAKYRNNSSKVSKKAASFSSAPYTFKNIKLRKSYPTTGARNCDAENGEMEIFIHDQRTGGRTGGRSGGVTENVAEFYDSFFPGVKESSSKKGAQNIPSPTSRDAYADIDVSLTFHQIAQMHRKEGQYGPALDAYRASLRGMKFALGEVHPNVAAILGNIGNLQKEMGDLDAAYDTYQDVLGIEVYRLGVSHPEVAISLHNVATIEAGRGNYQQALSIYQKVLNLQRKLFGDDNLAVAITSACMGEVFERLGDQRLAVDCYEETLRAKIAVLGRHDLQVARMQHKLGKMAFLRKDFSLAESYTARALLIYRLNKVSEEHEWLIDAERDRADIDAALALSDGRFCEV
jgi:tetratricopeptide (TPR) repeat protein